MTVGWWPWKSASSKECVTTHLPNVAALKMEAECLLCLALNELFLDSLSRLVY